MPDLSNRFWSWYERHYVVNVTFAAGLFTLQLVHLTWLSLHVVALRLFGESYFPVSDLFQILLVAVDYTEIPALITTSILYIADLRRGDRLRPIAFLLFLNSQWLHIFWITDEFVLEHFATLKDGVFFPHWLVWMAIAIDYLEIPVIVDTTVKVCRAFCDENIRDRFLRAMKYYVWRR